MMDMAGLRGRAEEEWKRLSSRDQVLSLLCAAAVLFFVLFNFVWWPMGEARQKMLDRHRELAFSSAHIRQNVSDLSASSPVKKERGTEKNNGEKSLSNMAQTTAKKHRIQIDRMQPADKDNITIWFKDTSFPGLVNWINELETDNGINFRTARIVSTKKPGKVNMQARLSR